MVKEFIGGTEVGFSAIAIGTAHGLYDGEVTLALDWLAEIRERVDIPLVLHGGLGLSDEQFRAMAVRGIHNGSMQICGVETGLEANLS
jgi:fructose/tagatose bisphosphate aldolase